MVREVKSFSFITTIIRGRWRKNLSSSPRICSKEIARDSGQSTLEAALILMVLLSLCTFLALMWRGASKADFAQYSLDAASHTLEGGVGDIQDIISF